VLNRITLRTKPKRHFLDVSIDSGNEEVDKEVNGVPTALACFYLVAFEQPSERRPLVLDQLGKQLERLALHGVGRKTGPGGAGVPSHDALSKGFVQVRKVMPLKAGWMDEDKRRACYYLKAPMPEIRVEAGDSHHYGDWQSFKHMLWRVLYDQGPESSEPHPLCKVVPRGSTASLGEDSDRSRRLRKRQPKAANKRPQMKRISLERAQPKSREPAPGSAIDEQTG
jgi:hypothetical protein